MPIAIEDTSYAKPWDHLKNTLAASARFQSIGGVASATDAKALIKMFWKSTALTATEKVRCTIRGLDDDISDQFALGAYQNSGPIVMFFQYVTPAAYLTDHENAGINFLNHLGKIRADMQTLAGNDPSQYLVPITIGLGVHGEADAKKNNDVPHWGAELIYSWQGQ